MTIHEVLTNVKVAVTVAATTISTGLGMFLDLIPDDIGKLATLIGIVLSVVLIYVHWLKTRILLVELKALKDSQKETPNDNANTSKP